MPITKEIPAYFENKKTIETVLVSLDYNFIPETIGFALNSFEIRYLNGVRFSGQTKFTYSMTDDFDISEFGIWVEKVVFHLDEQNPYAQVFLKLG